MSCFKRYTAASYPARKCLFCDAMTSNSTVIWIGHRVGTLVYLDVTVHYDGVCYRKFLQFVELVKLHFPSNAEVAEDITLDIVLKKVDFTKFCRDSKL